MEPTLIEKFEVLTNSRNLDEVYDLLLSFQPNLIGQAGIYTLLEYVEKKYKTYNHNYEHFNIFGTGGDKTVNISSIASVIASISKKYPISIVKTGTKAVTSKWGSRDFFHELSKQELLKTPELIDFNFIPLDKLGYKYSDVLLSARKELHKNNYLDIFKLIMPAANLTNASGQLNGVHREEYIPYFIDLALKFRKKMCIVHSVNFKVDELLFGNNLIINIEEGKVKNYNNLSIFDSRIDSDYLDNFKERGDILNHIQGLKDIISNKYNINFLDTILLKAAILLKLKYDKIDLEEILDSLRTEFQNEN